MSDLAKTYDPSVVEDKWYAFWDEHGFFHSDPDEREPYTIVIPPPNVTGVLHIGHVLNNTIQDVLIRRKRLEGYNACWVPGTDHASIATEAKVVALLREQGIKKSDLTREQFLEHAWAWKEKYGGIILQQLRKIGASCDWRRTRFTMDPPLTESVLRTFVDLHAKGLIYRGLRMINWDPAGRTALSDEEVIYKETKGKLYHIRYKIDSPDPEAWITIATTRPETILADTAIAVHPDDDRYRHLIGQHALLPFLYRRLPIVADDYVDPAFGVGCLKVTPAHDVNDYEIGQRHQLPVIDMLNPDGTLSPAAGLFVGEDRFEVRKKIVQTLRNAGHLVKEEEIIHKVGHSERTDAVVEPRLSLQWFVRMEALARPALEIVLRTDGTGVQLIPDRFLNIYRHWMENVHDWCISRQLWWGQRIPAWYWGEAFTQDERYVVALTREQAFAQARSEGYTGTAHDLRQDEDVLDTWFSSWLWPLTVFDGLIDPDNRDIKYYYPTNDLVTAPEILFFWVARMIMAGLEYRGERPFRRVYLTGIVRDKLGRKMSKSLGNSPEPLDLIEKYGADGLRMGILLCTSAGNDLMFDESLCEQGRNFANKIWNAFRLLRSLESRVAEQQPTATEKLALDWMEARIAEAAAEIETQFEHFRISDATLTVYRLFWDDFCAWYLELMKPAEGQHLSATAYRRTVGLLEQLLQLLHPFMPFITEEIWSHLAPRTPEQSLCISRLPAFAASADAASRLQHMDLVRRMVGQVRALRAERGLSPKVALELYLKTDAGPVIETYRPILAGQAGLSKLELVSTPPAGAVSLLVDTHELYVPLGEYIDVEAERRRIAEEIAYLEGFRISVEKKLSNEKFVANAKPEVVAKERQKLADAQAKLEALQAALAGL